MGIEVMQSLFSTSQILMGIKLAFFFTLDLGVFDHDLICVV